MDILHALVLAIVQGLTEFLPISSSAHLILAPKLLGWPDQGLAFDVAVHLGTLLAVLIYMRKEISPLFADWLQSIPARSHTGDSRLAWGIIIGTAPAGFAGLLLKDHIEVYLRSPLVIATTTIFFALVLWWYDRAKNNKKQNKINEHKLSVSGFLIIGCAQALALIPGTSRSGITITAALALGLSRTAAARTSFLFSIPIILAAGGLKTKDLLQQATPVDWLTLNIGVLVSFLSAYVCIHFFLKLLEKTSMLPFVIYRLLLGLCLLWIFWPA
jgi:undecaprenyl-diphosphatase